MTYLIARIKLLGRLSRQIDIFVGTEQGHPLSPELFKIYINDLSASLNSIKDIAVPSLNGKRVTHLLWADDLVLLALSKEALQKQFNVLRDYCVEWGLSVNMKKTAVMVFKFNKTGKIFNCRRGLPFNNTKIDTVRSYCYLGVTFTLSKSFKHATNELRHKANRGCFALRKEVDWKYLKRSTIITLFDSLIKPIVMYACPIWIPQITGDMLYSQWINEEVVEQQITTALAKLLCEQLYLSFLKWTLGTHKRTNNCAVWGDTGRYPLVISAIKQSMKYFERLQGLNGSGKLVEDAFSEQQKLDLPWYKVMSKIINFGNAAPIAIIVRAVW